MGDNDKIDVATGKGTWDGCPPDAHRCDDKCVFHTDNWTTPCRNIMPDGPSRAACVDWNYPYYCNHTDTCISVDDVCYDKCYTVSRINKYDHLAQRYLCEGRCLTEEMSCNGACDKAASLNVKKDEEKAELYVCGDMCLTEKTVDKMYICNGKCQDLSMPCNNTCEKGEMVQDSSVGMPYRALCGGVCKKNMWVCDGDCIATSQACGGKCFDGKVFVSEDDYIFRSWLRNSPCMDKDLYDRERKKYEWRLGNNNQWLCGEEIIPKTQSCKGKCEKFMCESSGDCLVGNQWPCDGKADCKDGSDEARETCIGPDATCPGVYKCGDEYKCNNELCGSCEEPDSICRCANFQTEYSLYDNGTYQACESVRKVRNGTCVGREKKRNPYGFMSVSIMCSDRSWCVTTMELCDGKTDCPDGSDEAKCDCIGMWNCSVCRIDKRDRPFTCTDGKGCLETEKVCDGIEDCEDGSDEFCSQKGCSKVYNKKLDTYQCDTTTWPAESNNDCDHRSRYCNGFCFPNSVPCNNECPMNHYNCDGQCVETNVQCKGVCQDKYYSCGDKCIRVSARKTYGNKFQVCDGIEDCPDGNDEKGCDCPGMWNCTGCLKSWMFNCDDGLACIELGKLCDGEGDCKDRSDEFCDDSDAWTYCEESDTYQ